MSATHQLSNVMHTAFVITFTQLLDYDPFITWVVKFIDVKARIIENCLLK